MTPAQLDHRIDVLLRLREAAGEWVRVGRDYSTGEIARESVRRWQRHCRETKWDAFDWKTHGCKVFGRFRGTRIEPCRNPRKVGATWTGAMMRRQG